MQELFDRMVESPPEQRSRLLRELSASDETLRTELETLLEADEKAASYLEQPPSMPGDDLPRSHPGRYRLLRQIGQGGSSVVYLAARADDTYRKRVAIKILRPGRADRDLLRRFANERQILASLEHPYIAGLYDGGVTEEGLPYFVMEHVEGLPIDEYCDTHGLGVEARLRLFSKVCEAVQCAHQKLVVHRDIKPSNILVGGDGIPKLLDFGIAKLLNPVLSSPDLTPTATWYRPFTPHYASPEQIRGQLISTRSDVYSLGVLLYLLLTGRLPYRLEGRCLEYVQRVVVENQVEQPSVAVRNENPEDGAVRRPPGLRADQLSRRLAGDLDTIVLKALRKEPGRRYGSVEAFSSDLGRFLEGRPVLARKDTVGYRLGKFAGRNRLLVGVVFLFLVVVSLLISFLGLQSARLARERDDAHRERDKSAQMLRFMQDVFSEVDPVTSGDAQPTALEILDRSTKKLEAFSEQPAVKAALTMTLGQIFSEQGHQDRAESLFRDALALHRSLPDTDEAEMTQVMGLLGVVLRKQGRLDESEEVQRRALLRCRQVFGEQSLEVSRSLGDLAVVLRFQGRFSEAEELYLEALETKRRLLGPLHEEVATILNNLATLYAVRFQHEAAERVYQEAFRIRRTVLGPDHLYTAFSRTNLAYVLVRRRRLDLAEEHHREGLGQLERILGDDHSDVSRVRILGAEIRRLRGDLPAAEALLRDLLADALDRHGESDPMVARLRSELGRVRQEQGDLEMAHALARSVFDHRRRAFGDGHPETCLSLDRLAEVVAARGLWDKALALQQKALAGLREVFGEEHPRLAPSLSRLAALHAGKGDWQRAEPLFQQALERVEKNPDRQPDVYSEILARQGEALLRADRPGEAEPLLRRAVEALAPTFPEHHPLSLQRREVLEHCRRAREVLDRD